MARHDTKPRSTNPPRLIRLLHRLALVTGGKSLHSTVQHSIDPDLHVRRRLAPPGLGNEAVEDQGSQRIMAGAEIQIVLVTFSIVRGESGS